VSIGLFAKGFEGVRSAWLGPFPYRFRLLVQGFSFGVLNASPKPSNYTTENGFKHSARCHRHHSPRATGQLFNKGSADNMVCANRAGGGFFSGISQASHFRCLNATMTL
jgi:hypothetical protein